MAARTRHGSKCELWWGPFYKPMLHRVARRGVAGFDAKFFVDRAEVAFDGAAADDQPLGDLRIAEVLHQQAQYLQLARGQWLVEL